MATKKANPSWVDIKAKLANFDRDGLLGLVQDLYAAGKDNQAFLHARLRLGDDVLKPYKATINRWLWPHVFKNQDISVAKAKKAIADYKKAGGPTEGLAELMGVLLRAGLGLLRRGWPGRRGPLRCTGADVRAGAENHRCIARGESPGMVGTP